MTRRDTGPRRSGSVDAYLLGTRILAAVAALALATGILSDLFVGAFWRDHALLAGLVSSVLVVMLSVGIFNEALERRRRQRWSVLAQYVLLGLMRNARMIWTGILDLSGLEPANATPGSVTEDAAPIVRDGTQLAHALEGLVSDPERRRAMHDEIARAVLHSDELLGRWAAVMLNADVYAEVIDRHVELASDLGWLSGILDTFNPPDDDKRRRLARASAAVQIEGRITDGMLVARLVQIAQLAEELDRGTLDLALRVVPIEWWQARLGSSASPNLRVPVNPSSIGRVRGSTRARRPTPVRHDRFG